MIYDKHPGKLYYMKRLTRTINTMAFKLSIKQDCHPGLAMALTNFIDKITPGNSTTSKKHSIWELCNVEVQEAIQEALESVQPGLYTLIAGAKGFASEAKKNARQLEDRLREHARIYSLKKDFWGENKCAYDTLETLISLVTFLLSHRPHTVGGNNTVRRIRLNKAKTNDHFPWCELCWRLCQAEEMRLDKGKLEFREDGKAIIPSDRFCDIHNPKKPNSAYRSDHNHRFAFHLKIENLEAALKNGTHEDGIEELKAKLEASYYKNNIDEVLEIATLSESERFLNHEEKDEIIRRIAYKLIHPQHQTRKPQSETLKRAIALKAQKLSQAEIARRLGVSRQAIWKSLNSDKA